ncbi:ribose ABC transporter substrate-binding protein RbsB [Aerococcaceae bacterium DSM 111020]|nr:ribose ABC transporter substrate-binding protein RbsB [Aerococcaceae bacterium DSM 111020]
MKKKNLLLILLFGLVIILAGCGQTGLEGENAGNSDDQVAEKSIDELKIGLSISTTNNPFFVNLRDGVLETAKEKGMEVVVVDAQDDTSVQLNGMEDLIQQQVDIILVNPVDSDAITPAVESANSAGIPVMTIDRSSAGGDVVSLIASDNVKGGEMAANFIVEELDENAKVIELEGIPGASAANERGEGFNNIAQDKLEVLDSQTANFNRAEGLTVMENMLQAHPDIEAVFAQNDEMALGAIEAIEAAGKLGEILVVGFDGNEDAIKSVEDGKLGATIAQQPYEMGKISIEAVEKLFSGEQVDENIPSPLELVK